MKKFSREYHIRSYECDKDSNLRIVTLMNILQDAADANATELGVGFDFCMKNGLAWMGANYRIIIDRLPKMHEKIRVESWPSEQKRVGAIRDFAIYDENEIAIIKATSQWILINVEKKRPVALKENLPFYSPINERAINYDFEKMEELKKIDCEQKFLVRYDDIDLNKHVNNSLYPLWAFEAIDYDFRDNYLPHDIEIAFKKECMLGEKIMVHTDINELTTLHSITAMNDNRELAKIRIMWRSR